MSDFDRIEEQRERNEEFAYDEYRERMRAPVSEDAEQEDTLPPWCGPNLAARFKAKAEQDAAAYDISDPKHPNHHDVYADVWDMREGK